MTYPTKKLGEILDIVRNGKSCKQNKEGKGSKITRIETISKGIIDEKRVGFFELTNEDKNKYSIKKGDILFSHINSVIHVGKIAISKIDYDNLFHGMNLLLLRGNKNDIIDSFLYITLQFYFKSGYWSKVCKKAINQASVNQKDILSIQIPLPPLPTQKLIVQKLDSAFKNINESIKITKKNIDNIEELNKSSLEESINNSEYKKYILKSLLDKCEYGSSEKASSTKEEGLPILRMGNIQNGGIDYNKLKYSDKKSKTIPKLYLKKDDLLFNRTNSWELVGKTGIYLGNDDEFTFAGYLIRLKFTDKVLQKYGNYFFNSQFFRKTQIEPQIDQQCGQANFSGGKLKETIFPLPPLSKQKEIVLYLDEVFDKNKVIKERYEKKLKDLEEMKQSILKEAFEGRLIKD